MLNLRAEHKLRVLENGLQRRLFGPKSEEVKREWRKLQKEGLNDLYCSLNIIRLVISRIMRWAEHIARGGEKWPMQGVRGEI